MKTKRVLKLGLAATLLASLLLLSACGGQVLNALLIAETASNAEAPSVPHTIEGRSDFCLTCHLIDDVSVGDISDLIDSGSALFQPGQTTHAGLSEISCTICHSGSWRAIKSSGLPAPIGDLACEDCHGTRPTEPPPH